LLDNQPASLADIRPVTAGTKQLQRDQCLLTGSYYTPCSASLMDNFRCTIKSRSVITMTTATARSEDVMTDYQFKSILKMVLDLAESTNDIEKIKKSLRNLIGEKFE
jgi:hypothetical protein